MRKGFTLVELSIVLVIIGLLIGGILVAQSLVDSAKIQSFIRQIGQIDSAVITFKSKYNGLPGDARAFGGDGDGIIETTETNAGTHANTAMAFNYELANFWPNLQQNDFLANEYDAFSSDASSGIRVNTHAPKSELGSDNAAIILHHNYVFPGAPWYYIGDFEATTDGSQSAVAGVIWPVDALAVDTKIDDGIPRIADMTTYDGYMWASAASASCYDTSGGSPYSYDLSIEDEVCAPLISIGHAAGAGDL